MFAEAIGAAVVNYAELGGEADQVVYVVRVRGDHLRFYKVSVPRSYIETLHRPTSPHGQVSMERFPPVSGGPFGKMTVGTGLNLLDSAQRETALRVLYTIRKQVSPTPPPSP